MDRTKKRKQTARMSTGGKGPRKYLLATKPHRYPPGTPTEATVANTPVNNKMLGISDTQEPERGVQTESMQEAGKAVSLGDPPVETWAQNEGTGIATSGMVASVKETIGGLSISRAPIKTTPDSAPADGQERGLANVTIPDSQSKRAQNESTETSHVGPSQVERNFLYDLFWV
jgi:hypothetical protein